MQMALLRPQLLCGSCWLTTFNSTKSISSMLASNSSKSMIFAPSHLHKLGPYLRSSICTSTVRELRKRPNQAGFLRGERGWLAVALSPFRLIRDLVEAFARRKLRNTRFETFEESYKRGIYHRMAQLYAVLTWTGVGLAMFIYTRPKTEEELAAKANQPKTPHDEMLKQGGALWWASTLKSPEEMQNTKSLKVIRMKGLSYEGVVDITRETKETGQALKSHLTGGFETGADDHYLRRFIGVPQVNEGGPSPEQLRKDLEAQGRNYDITLDFANKAHGVATRYNKDGSVGLQIRSQEDLPTRDEIAAKQKETEEALEEGDLVL